MLLRARSTTIDTWDLDSHGEHLTLQQLRELGERLQQLHPGVQDMGQASLSQVCMYLHCMTVYLEVLSSSTGEAWLAAGQLATRA